MVGVDSSEHSRHAQTLAFCLARKLHASVPGLRVFDILSFEQPLFNDIAAPADLESYRRESIRCRSMRALKPRRSKSVRAVCESCTQCI